MTADRPVVLVVESLPGPRRIVGQAGGQVSTADRNLTGPARGHRLAMLPQTLEVAFDRIPNVFGRFGARSALGNTTRHSGARPHKHTVFVLFQVNAISH